MPFAIIDKTNEMFVEHVIFMINLIVNIFLFVCLLVGLHGHRCYTFEGNVLNKSNTKF